MTFLAAAGQASAWALVAAALGGYLFGSIPFGLVLTKLAGLGDIRTIGSGNIGATNVLRTGRKDLALATLLLDGGKGAVAVLLARLVSEDLTVIAGGAAILGHLFPVWLKFKGGKGVATTLGTLIAANWMVGIGACVVWLIMALLFRYSSLSALIAVASAPFIALWVGTPPQAWLAAFAALLVWIRHHENIRRLLKGEEPKIGKKKAAA
ncbi:MAG: glycerol-3-phosphate 1-O-acyltransferase PlsY [Rhodospirillaceae bacterium]|nr:glycerol-3-phosphate 1-O-acyltransferase PlsY [Rhodospirillaceae bacterium]